MIKYEALIKQIKALDAKAGRLEAEAAQKVADADTARWEQAEKIYLACQEKSQREVAQDTGLKQVTVSRYRTCWVDYSDSDGITFSEAMAEVRGGTTRSEEGFRATLRKDPERSVREATKQMGPTDKRRIARELNQQADDEGVAANLPLAEMGERTQRQHEERERSDADAQFVQMDYQLTEAKEALTAASELSPHVSWEDEHKDLIKGDLEKIRKLVDLVEMGITSGESVDWDAEIERITGE